MWGIVAYGSAFRANETCNPNVPSKSNAEDLGVLTTAFNELIERVKAYTRVGNIEDRWWSWRVGLGSRREL